MPELLAQSTGSQSTPYLIGHETLGWAEGGAWRYILPDGLGSVRQTTDGAGAVVRVREWTPYGEEMGAAQMGLGYTGEWWDADVGLLYLRARWYAPGVGRFTSRDPLPGFPNRPRTFHAFVYAHNNPINLTDRSGLAPWVDCANWPTYLGLKKLCEQANGDDNDPEVLDARERIFSTIATGGQILCSTGGGPGYCWASGMLSWFLGASGSHLDIRFYSSNGFTQDPGIARATRGLRDPQTGICTPASFSVCGVPGCVDEPDRVTPLLWEFLQKYVQPVAGTRKFSVQPVTIQGISLYSDELPRPYDTGWWAAFGHVEINGTFSAKGKRSCHPEGYVIRYQADYRIEDEYRFFPGKLTPFHFPGTDTTVWIPHEWELSLVYAAPPRAQFYQFTISWREKERILVGLDFSWYRPAAWWEGLF